MSDPFPRNADLKLVAAVASALSLLAFLHYFQRGEILLYGDAVAHINIARRVFDSQTPGLLQLGTVWLPLPHLLMLPFLASHWMWQTGVGGSIPSMLAYILSVVGVFRLTRALLDDAGTPPAANAGAWLAAAAFAMNPNLLYLQSTAMTEPVYLAFFVWAVVYFADLLRAVRPEMNRSAAIRALYRCSACLAGAELTRYDGWFLAAVTGAVMLAHLRNRWRDPVLRALVIRFALCISLAPLLWLAYNVAVYGDAFEFANGPYSAKAIEQRTATPGYASHPGGDHPVTAAAFFLKAAQLNMADGNWGRIWIVIALAGTWWGIRQGRSSTMLLLWSPVAFYALSIAYSGVPLFLPTWWPFTWYNLRYGLQLLPLFSVTAGLLLVLLLRHSESSRGVWRDRLRRAGPFVVLATLVLSYFSVWRTQPLSFKEAWVNSRTKLALESSIAQTIASLSSHTVYLMYIGDHVGALQQAGIPLRQVINEGNHRPWKKPNDPDGLWEKALANPSAHVDVVIACDGDAVDQQVNRSSLVLVKEIHTLGQPRARVYLARGLNQSR